MSGKAFLLALALMILTGCGSGVAEPTSPPVPSPLASPTAVAGEPPPAVPPATLTNGAGESQQAVVGSYCWPIEGSVACLDSLAVQAPSMPLTVAPVAPLTFALPNEPLTMVTMRVLGWKTIEGEAPNETTLVAPDAPLLASGDLEPAATIAWEAPPEPGEYFLDMMTVYQNGGTIAYGWHILVAP